LFVTVLIQSLIVKRDKMKARKALTPPTPPSHRQDDFPKVGVLKINLKLLLHSGTHSTSDSLDTQLLEPTFFPKLQV